MSEPTDGLVILRLQKVSKIYRMGEVDVPALREVTLDIHDGEFLIVAGPSGCGKSTLLNLIGGMDKPTDGTIIFLDQDLTTFSDPALTLYRRNQVGFVFQFYNLIPTLTALENVQVAIEIVGDPLDPLDTLDLVGLADRADHFPAQLSGGEQQRVAIARALAGNPRLLLCDEPTGALDFDTSKQVLSMLIDLNRRLNKTIVLITHSTAIPRIGHRVAHLLDGRVRELQVNDAPKTVEQVEW